jgi:hypothetical protein
VGRLWFIAHSIGTRRTLLYAEASIPSTVSCDAFVLDACVRCAAGSEKLRSWRLIIFEIAPTAATQGGVGLGVGKGADIPPAI